MFLNELPNGQSSPGNLQSGQHPSKAILQIPQFSSLATHLQVATPVQLQNHNHENASVYNQSIYVSSTMSTCFCSFLKNSCIKMQICFKFTC